MLRRTIIPLLVLAGIAAQARTSNLSLTRQEGVMQWVNTRIGMSGHGCSFMGVAVPFGVLPFVPDNFNKGWGWCSGYHDPVRRILYSGLYHVFLQPNLFNDCYGTYCGADGKNYEALGRDTCTIFSLCDTYRTAYPLYTLLQIEFAPDPVNTMLEFIPNKAFGATPEYCSVEC